MKIFALATALLATVANATPVPVEVRDTNVLITITGAAQTPVEVGNAEVLVTFIGAADASFTQYFSLGDTLEHIRT